MDSNTVVVTCISSNYLAYARALVNSIRRFEPDLSIHVVIVDGDGNDRIDDEALTCIAAAALGVPDWRRFAFQYTAFELSCAVKPFALSHALESGYSRAIYLDADMYVCSSLSSILDELSEADVLLSPHAFTALPSDERLANDQLFLSRGIFNAGFLAIRESETTQLFLQWWRSKCQNQCYVDTRRGLFVDQCWLNFAPTLFPRCQPVRQLGVNVGYWNLHERNVQFVDDRYCVDQHPLVCFHFSGFDFRNPTELSAHQNRLNVRDFPAVSKLAREYADSVATCQSTTNLPYRFATLSDGTPIKASWREAVRMDHQRLRNVDDPFAIRDRTALKQQLSYAAIDAVHAREDWRAAGMRMFFYRIARLPIIRWLWLLWIERELVGKGPTQ